MFNARAESLARSNAFREPFRRRRCVVPVSGFYEWQRAAGRKLPHYVRATDADGLLLAGIWDRWQGELDGAPATLESFAVITTRAHAELAFLHDRQPAMLDREAAEAWLDGTASRADLEGLLVPGLPGALEVVPVSSWVNDARHKGPECVQAVGRVLTVAV